jgi:steroid delta-isomerase-like uncharacterized protein
MAEASEVVERMVQLFDDGDVAASLECFAPDATFVNPLSTLNGREEIRGLFEAFASAFTDLRHNLSSRLEAGDRFAYEGRITGTHTGTLSSPVGEIPATGRSIDYRFAAVGRVTEGRIVELRSYWDVAELMTQLGLMPEPAATAV